MSSLDSPVPPERWCRIEELFERAIGCEVEDRAELLAVSCGEDTVLRREVESLLVAHEQAGTFIGRPAGEWVHLPASASAASWAGRRIGPYTAVREIGRGGMGRVLLAQRADREYEGRVAIKVVDAPLAARGLLERFRRERQILADLDHPNIARLLDAGTLPEGVPYLVMEAVNGERIDRYCDRERLSVDARIRLFRQVCDAVEYAHRRLVVHRDLKPANVLVTPEGRPKLLDFGIAKLLAAERGDDFTITAQLPMTPRYASPEQVRGGPVGTATDVYSLGVLLYDLLAGRTPFGDEDMTFPELIRRVVDVEPRRPSAAADPAAAAARGTSLLQLRRRLEGDLDNVVLTALRKDPERRYPSVRQLSDDLRRHLEDLPLSARPDTWAYRAGKFWRRNRIAASLGAALAASLVVFTTLVAVQGRKAARQRDRAEEALDFVLQGVEASDPSTGTAVVAPMSAQEFLEAGARRAATELADEPDLQAPILHRIGNAYIGLGLYREAAPLLARAVEIEERNLGADNPETLDSLASLARARLLLAEYRPAEVLYRRVLAARRRQLGPAHPSTLEAMRGLADALRSQDRLDEAEALLVEAAKRVPEALGPGAAALGEIYQALASVYRARGDGEAYLRYARLESEAFGAAYPPGHTKVAEGLNNLAVALQEQGRLEEAIPLYRQARKVWLETLPEDHPFLLASQAGLAEALRDLGRYAEAEPLLRAVLAARIERSGPDHPRTLAVLKNYAELEAELGRFQSALADRERLVAGVRKALPERHVYLPWSLSELGASWREAGDLDRAEALQQEALVRFRELRGDDHPMVSRPLLELARIARLRGRLEVAEKRAREALALRRRLLPRGHPDLAEAQRELGNVLLARGYYTEAEPLLHAGLRADDGSYQVHGIRRIRALEKLVELYRLRGREDRARREASELAAAEAELRDELAAIEAATPSSSPPRISRNSQALASRQ